jgi:hypothetical protein
MTRDGAQQICRAAIVQEIDALRPHNGGAELIPPAPPCETLSASPMCWPLVPLRLSVYGIE